MRASTPWLEVPPVVGTATEFVLDSGFDDDLAADTRQLRSRGWQLHPIGVRPLKLADGSTISYRLFGTSISWFGAVREVTVTDKTSGDPLLGYGLLRGTRVRFGAEIVEIEVDPR